MAIGLQVLQARSPQHRVGARFRVRIVYWSVMACVIGDVQLHGGSTTVPPDPVRSRQRSVSVRRRLAYPLFERSRPRNVCGRFSRATASTVMNRYDSFDICMETTTLHAYCHNPYIDGRPVQRIHRLRDTNHPLIPMEVLHTSDERETEWC